MPRRQPARGPLQRADVPLELLGPPPDELPDEARWVAVRADAGTVLPAAAEDVELRECLFTDVDLSGRDLTRLRARDVRFVGCDLSGTRLDESTLERVEFAGCRMTGVMITGAELRHVVLRECRADLANLRMTTASRLLAVATSLREADLYDSRLTDSALLDCDLTAATWRGCRLTDVDLHGSRLEDVRDAAGLAGASIGPDQVVPLALSLLAAQGIAVTGAARMSGED